MYKLGKNRCPKCTENGNDKNGDNLHWYGDDNGGHCFACGYTIPSKDYAKEPIVKDKFIWEDNKVTEAKQALTEEEAKSIQENSGVKSQGTRGISDETYKVYAVRFEYDSSGLVHRHLYPATENYQRSGYKVRTLPKNFKVQPYGKWGSKSDLFGQWRFKNHHSKTVVITAGEEDCCAAYEILEKRRKQSSGSDKYQPTPVVSPLIGETSSYVQIQNQYEWLNRADKIIVCYDSDDAGREALGKLYKVLPKGKMYVMELPEGFDSNKMLNKGREQEWFDAFFKAKPYTPDGILPSNALTDKIREAAMVEKIPFPPFMHRLQDVTAGGIPLGVIVNLGGASGCGKTTYCDELVYYWVMNSPHRIGVLSLEADAGQYGINVLSRHIGRKINLIADVNEKLELLDSHEVQEAQHSLFFNDTGNPRWDIIDERDGGLKDVQEQIKKLISKHECKVIIIDPLQDLIEGLSTEEQALFMKWQKGMVKSHSVTFININHTRKTSNGDKSGSTGAMGNEEDFHGSSAIYKSGALNLIFSRNKDAEDDIERNTTYLKATKCRWTGKSGMVGQYYYDNDTHTMYDKLDYFGTNNPVIF